MKKVLALTLVLVLAFSMSTMAFAAGARYTGQKAGHNWYDGYTTTNSKYENNLPSALNNGGPLDQENELGDVWACAGNDITIYLNEDNFARSTDTDYNTRLTASNATEAVTLTKQEISDSKIALRVKVSKGSSVIDKVELKAESNQAGESRVVVEFVHPWKSNNKDGQDFELHINPMVNKKDVNFTTLSFSGTYKNDVDDDLGSDTDYYDFEDHNILIPSDFIRVFDGYMGEGVTFNMRGIKNAKYQGWADQDITDKDQDILVKYAAIDEVYHTYLAGNFANVVNYITFEDIDPTAYVYDGNLNYLGRGSEKITTLSDTYYIASAVLDVDVEDEPEEDDDDDYEPEDWGGNTSTGGDDLYPENPHDNPGTGK